MTREEHIAKAEELLAGRWEKNVYAGYPDLHVPPTEHEVALAQVHATLAAATTPAPEAPAALGRVSRWRRAVSR